MLRLHAAHHRDELVNLPPSNRAVRFDQEGFSDEVDQDTADMCCAVPGFRADTTDVTHETETDEEPAGLDNESAGTVHEQSQNPLTLDADDDDHIGDEAPRPDTLAELQEDMATLAAQGVDPIPDAACSSSSSMSSVSAEPDPKPKSAKSAK